MKLKQLEEFAMLAALMRLMSLTPVQAAGTPAANQNSLAWVHWFDDPSNRGEVACDTKLMDLQRQEIDRLFRARIVTRRGFYLAAHGPDPDFDVSGGYSCIRSARVARRAFRAALRRFDGKLHAFERRYQPKPGN